MLKLLKIIFLFLFCTVFGQKILPFDSLRIKDVHDFFADDYGNIYLYKNKDFSFTKYDSLGKQLGKMMMTVPFTIENVQNPLNIVLFSENAQEMKFVDQNLNEIQKINFSQKFGFIKAVYAEDLQQIWILDESTKRLVQYDFRLDNIINAYPFNIDFDPILDMLVFENRLYILSENNFSVFNFKGEKIFENAVQNGKKLRRENRKIDIISKNAISEFAFPKEFKTVFSSENAKIVDKNSTSYFEIKQGKFYIYELN
jgi:hypothetical protein